MMTFALSIRASASSVKAFPQLWRRPPHAPSPRKAGEDAQRLALTGRLMRPLLTGIIRLCPEISLIDQGTLEPHVEAGYRRPPSPNRRGVGSPCAAEARKARLCVRRSLRLAGGRVGVSSGQEGQSRRSEPP